MKDARGVEVDPGPHRRVVSLVPSTTESLYALGVPPVGITRFCVRPFRARKEAVLVGGTKDIEWDRLEQLAPDLVIGNVEENSREIAEGCEARGLPIFMQFPRSLDDVVLDLVDLGRLVGADPVGHIRSIQTARGRVGVWRRPFRYAYLNWRKPWMAAGTDTFISAVLAELGGENVVKGRYPTLELEQLGDADVVLLSSEPYPFTNRHRLTVRQRLPHIRAALVDGEACSWHGVGLARGLHTLAQEVPRWLS